MNKSCIVFFHGVCAFRIAKGMSIKMCEANAYFVDENGEETLFLESVDTLNFDNDKIIMQSIFGEQKIVAAKIKELALVEHKILLSKI